MLTPIIAQLSRGQCLVDHADLYIHLGGMWPSSKPLVMQFQIWGVSCSNIEGALDDLKRRINLASCDEERMHGPLEV